jgi:hypothetical protein
MQNGVNFGLDDFIKRKFSTHTLSSFLRESVVAINQELLYIVSVILINTVLHYLLQNYPFLSTVHCFSLLPLPGTHLSITLTLSPIQLITMSQSPPSLGPPALGPPAPPALLDRQTQEIYKAGFIELNTKIVRLQESLEIEIKKSTEVASKKRKGSARKTARNTARGSGSKRAREMAEEYTRERDREMAKAARERGKERAAALQLRKELDQLYNNALGYQYNLGYTERESGLAPSDLPLVSKRYQERNIIVQGSVGNSSYSTRLTAE